MKRARSLSVENDWELGGRELVAKEIVTLRVHPADPAGRAIDIELLITAVGGPLELQGTPDQNKGYGGLCFRSAPLLKGATMTTDKGPLEEDAVNTPFRWADISTAELGVAVFVRPAIRAPRSAGSSGTVTPGSSTRPGPGSNP